MTKKMDSGECDDFVENIQRHLGDLLSRYDFRSVQCDSHRDDLIRMREAR